MENTKPRETNQYVIFYINKEEYGIDIQKITTIEKLSNITRVPHAADIVKGVINLRGEIVPVIDMCKKLKMENSELDGESRIIIFKIDDQSVGFIVDKVVEVINIDEDNMEKMINISENDTTSEYIAGIGKVKDRIITILNLEKLISLK